MSKAKPTPMPWELRGWSIKHPGNGFRICIVKQPDKGLRQFGGDDYDDMMAECKANAELIASAPMLAHANVQQAEEIKALAARLAEVELGAERAVNAFEATALTLWQAKYVAETRLAEVERDMDQLIGERDHAQDMADKLADALAALLGVEIGEHSSENCPWQNALEAFEERPNQPSVTPLVHGHSADCCCVKCEIAAEAELRDRRASDPAEVPHE